MLNSVENIADIGVIVKAIFLKTSSALSFIEHKPGRTFTQKELIR